MKARSLSLVALTALALVACSKKAPDQPAAPSAPVAAVPPPAGKSWTDVVSQTPEGGFLMGNPNAPVKLIEYASYTCPHCKAFEAEGVPSLRKDYVDTGKVSWEFRSFLIHGPDASVTLLVNCRGAQPFFPLAEQLYAAQDDWLGKIVALPTAEQQRIASLPPVDSFKAMASASGLYGFLGARGLPRTQADACLSDQKAIDKMTADQKYAEDKMQVTGTPSFFINGQQQQDVASWDKLEPRLKAAIGG